MEGDDMAPIIKSGSTVIANVEKRGIIDRELYVLKIHGKNYIRWIEQVENDSYKIESENEISEKLQKKFTKLKVKLKLKLLFILKP